MNCACTAQHLQGPPVGDPIHYNVLHDGQDTTIQKKKKIDRWTQSDEGRKHKDGG